MITQLAELLSRFHASLEICEGLTVRRSSRFYMVDQPLRKHASRNFSYAGTYLGRIEAEKFVPSFSLLRLVAEAGGNMVTVDEKTAWLFICGRDVFRRGVLRVEGSPRKGDYALIMNKRGECLGYGEILSLESGGGRVAVKNVLDLGDFLRREKQPIGGARGRSKLNSRPPGRYL